MKKQKGFTIIELIVVIAIIAVLAGVVLVNVTQYINKGKDAAIKGNLSSVMTNGAVYADNNTTYAGFCGSPGATVPLTAADTAWGTGGTAAVCFANSVIDGTVPINGQWCACKQLKSDTAKVFCVDSSGKKAESTAACTAVCVTATGKCL
jgi:prepilin-type N-terminal cleavage/methylation domain-containing protein